MKSFLRTLSLLFVFTLMVTPHIIAQALNGSYTINPSSSASNNFTSFTALATALNTNGVSGPVSVTVSSGTYNEAISLTNISGASATNTITIDGGDSSLTIVTHDGSSQYATLILDSTKHVSFKNMTFRMTSGSVGVVILLRGADYNTFQNCETWINPNLTATTVNNIVFSNSLTSSGINTICHHNVFENNRIIGGYRGIYAYSGAVANRNVGNKFLNNHIDSVYYYGAHFSFQDSLEFIGNYVNAINNNNTNSYAVHLASATNLLLKQNYLWAKHNSLHFTNAGITAANGNGALVGRRIEISNNMVYSLNQKGMTLEQVDSADVWHNSVYVEGTEPAFHIGMMSTTSAVNNDVRNNIFASLKSPAFKTGTPVGGLIIGTRPTHVGDTAIFSKLDYNIYYTKNGSVLLEIGDSSYADLQVYRQRQPLYNTASIEGDPTYVSPTDLHISGILPYEKGDNSVGISVDIDGEVRPGPNSSTVDIGADEFVPPSCIKVSKVKVTEIAFQEVSISWESNSHAAPKEFIYEVYDCNNQLITSSFTSQDSLRVSGLTSKTCYQLFVREVCDRGDTSSWMGPVKFYTKQKTPFFEDFEDFSHGFKKDDLPYNWTTVTHPVASNAAATPTPRWQAEASTGQNQGTANTGPKYDHTQFGTVGGKYMLSFNTAGLLVIIGQPPNGDSTDLISDPIYVDPSEDVLELNFWYFMYGNNIDKMQILIDTNGVQTVVGQIIGQRQLNQDEEWRDTSIYLQGLQGKDVRLIFRGHKAIGNALTGGGIGDVAIDDITLKAALKNNAGVVGLVTQGALCPGVYAPTVAIRNNGFDTLKTVDIVWEVNGVKDTLNYSGSIAKGDTAHVTLGNVNISATQLNDLIFYTMMPNGVVDEFHEDDTLKILNAGVGLNGVYTVDPSLSASATNFTSLDSLSKHLTMFGICGATTVNLAHGVYNEPLFLESIGGLSATNTLLIDGGDSSRTIITHNGTDRYATVTISSGASYVSLKNLTIERTYHPSLPALGAALLFAYGPDYNTVSNCEIRTEKLATAATGKYNILFSGSASSYISNSAFRSHNTTIENNKIVGGYYGLMSQSLSLSPIFSSNTKILNNTVDSVFHMAFSLHHFDSLEIIGNKINAMDGGNANNTAVELTRTNSTILSSNYIWSNGSAVIINNSYLNSPLERRFNISNNMLYSKDRNGLRIEGLSYVDIYHNTISGEGTNAGNTVYTFYIHPPASSQNIDSYDVRNNIFRSEATIAFSSLTSDAIFDKFDNNIFYSGDTNLFEIGSRYYSLADYLQNNTQFNQNSIEADPIFVSATDLHINPSSKVASEAGDNSVGIAVDIDGNPRPYPNTYIVAIGAHEYLPTDHCYYTHDVTIEEVLSTSATFSWKTHNASAITYEYALVECGDTLPFANVNNTALDSITVNGLTMGTCYEFYVRSVCGNADTSIWAGPYTFNTIFKLYYPIGDLNTVDVDGVADSLGVNNVWTSGIVVGANLDSIGYNFTLIDMSSHVQEGIRIYNDTIIDSYVVTEGDSLMVRGEVKQNFGLIEFHIDSIEVISSNHAIPTAISVSIIDESVESKFVEMKDFILLDSSQTGTYEMRAFNGTDTITILISEFTEVSDSLAILENALSIGDTLCVFTGIGSQYDLSNTAPYLSGYHVIPMAYADVSVCKLVIPTGIVNYKQSETELNYYPNPSNGEFTIESSGLNNDNAVITIYDISGKVILEESINNSSQAFKKEYNLNGQASGLYFIHIIDGNNRITKKLILQ